MANNIFTKNDLRAGYIVVIDGAPHMVMYAQSKQSGMCNRIIAVNNHGGWTDLNEFYTDDLVHANDGNLTITEVYGYNKYAHMAREVSTDQRPLLWKRAEAKKMTISEIEKELGYKIEVVAGETE